MVEVLFGAPIVSIGTTPIRSLLPNLGKILPRIGPGLANVRTAITTGGKGAAGARSSRSAGTQTAPAASNIGSISKSGLAKSLGTSTAITAGSIAGITAIQGAIKPLSTDPSVTTAIQELAKTASTVSDNTALPLADLTKFARENATLLLILGLGITAVVLIK